jgi:FeS assembly SUF system regulator
MANSIKKLIKSPFLFAHIGQILFMLKIGKLTDYAVLILSQMARSPAATLSASSLAEQLSLTVPTVSKILKMLAEANLLKSTRGAEGGYYLARPAGAITIAEILAAMEGAVAMTECCSTNNQCTLSSLCVMEENWKTINRVIYTVLNEFTLNDMLAPLTLKGVTIHG